MAQKVSVADGQAVQYNTIKARLYLTPAQAEPFEKLFLKGIDNQALIQEHNKLSQANQVPQGVPQLLG